MDVIEQFKDYPHETVMLVKNGMTIYERIKNKEIKFPDSTFLFSNMDKVVISLLISSFLNFNIKEAFEEENINMEDVFLFINADSIFTDYSNLNKHNFTEKTVTLFNNLLNEIRKNDSSLKEKENVHIEAVIEALFYPNKCGSNVLNSFFNYNGFLKKPFYHPSYDNILKLIEKRQNHEENILYDDYNYEEFMYEDLKDYGVFLDEKIYSINPAVGREEELKKLMISLLIEDSSSLIVGDAGVGKTSLVDGLNYLIKKGKVPERLKNIKILSLNVASLLAGTKYRGDFEKKIEDIIETVKELDNVILYIDEFHTVMGAGATTNKDLDFANMLKPYLSSGEIKIIGATTTNEYEKIKEDKAFKRRFNKVEIKEPSDALLHNIISSTILKLQKETDVNFELDNETKEQVINTLIEVTKKTHRKYDEEENNPALALRILKKAYAYSLYENSYSIKIEHIKNAIMEEETLYESAREKAVKNLEKELKELNNVIDFARYRKNV